MLREALTFERLNAMPADEAAALFVERRAEGLTQSERELLEAWLSENKQHRRELERADAAWNLFAGAENDELLSAMRAHALAPPANAWLNRRALAAAAAAFLVIGTGLLTIPNLTVGPRGNSGGPGGVTGASVEYASAPGQIRNVVLADGTALTLDADSLVAARLGQTERSVQLLRGRALFDVHHDSSRPFIVGVNDRRIVDIGTRFDVNLAAETVTVTVFVGKVAVGTAASKGTPVALSAGQQFVDRGGNITVRPQDIGPGQQPAWRSGLLVFDDTTLREASAEVNRYTNDHIVITSPQLGAMRVSGQFRAGDPDRFAQTVADIHPMRIIHRANAIELVSAQ